MTKKVLVTGNLGYIGSVMTPILLKKGYDVVGYDTNYFPGFAKTKSHKLEQITKDIRAVEKNDLEGIDAVIHLAALSNDPLGEFNPKLTKEINYKATIKLAKLAKTQGVEKFVYSSSQSMYGISQSKDELDEDDSEKNPITEYAKTKWQAELELKELSNDNFTVICMRPSTVFGASPKLRCDIVYNNLVACAYTTGKIEIKSDGTPWRPIVHIQDVTSAFIAALKAPKKLVANESFNIGIKNGNYTVKQLAKAAQKAVPGSELTFTGEHGKGSRTYKVSFEKILTRLRNYYKPRWDLESGGEELVDFFKKVNFTEEDFRGMKTIRLEQLKYLTDNKFLDNKLYWSKSPPKTKKKII